LQASIEQPLVDVGVPAHGAPVFLAETIESILAQTYRNLRLTILDDSGGAAIEQAVRPFLDDERVDYRQTGPLSATQAMSALIQAGDGRYFAFLHDDDRWDSGFLARRVEFLERHPECGLVLSGHVDINDRGEITARAAAPYPEGVVPRELIVPEMQRRNVIDVMHCVLARRSALEQAGPALDDDFPRLFDWELWLRMVLRFPVGCIEARDAQYRAHDAQMSSDPGRAGDFRQLLEHADRLAAELAPEHRLGERERRRRRAGLDLSESLDHLQAGDSRAGRQALRRAVRTDPAVVKDRRFVPALAGGLGGAPGRAAVSRMRAGRWRRLQTRRSGS
jgi:glycosyltransferase involved in cell wall biosynthesis